jgi:CheY-like chemotaxis protein
LRAHPVLSEVPVVVISADVSVEQMERMEALGISEYLKKPFNLHDLRRSINQALRATLVC